MDARTLLDEHLNFDRYNVHITGRDISSYIEQACDIIHNVAEEDKTLKSLLCRQVCIYYLFFMRDSKVALRYVQLYTFLSDSLLSLQIAEAYIFMGCTRAIRTEHKSYNEFKFALKIYTDYEEKNNPLDFETKHTIAIGKALALRYIGLISSRNNHKKRAQAKIDAALELLRDHLRGFPEVHLDIAECYHIQGLIYQDAKHPHKKMAAFKNADEEMQSFRSSFGRVRHPLELINRAWLGWSILEVDRKEALCHLAEAKTALLDYFGIEVQSDIATLYQLMGEAYKGVDAKITAQYLSKALKIKQCLYGNGISLSKENPKPATSKLSDKLKAKQTSTVRGDVNGKDKAPALNESKAIKLPQPIDRNYQAFRLFQHATTPYLHEKFVSRMLGKNELVFTIKPPGQNQTVVETLNGKEYRRLKF